MIKSRYYGPAFARGEPRQIVIHSAETPMVRGLSRSLAKGWWQNPANKSSAHVMADPAETVVMVPTSQRAWHCGNGNNTSLGAEHTGYAHYSKKQWTSAVAIEMLRHSAWWTAKECKKRGIPARWLSLAQLRRNEKGLCTHNDMRIVRGGTTHTDPGPNFPYALYLQMVKQELGEDMSALDGDKRIKLNDYRGRFTDGSSDKENNTIEHFVGNTWEFTKYNAGRLDQLAVQVAALTRAVNKLSGSGGGGDAAGTYTGTLKMKKK